MKVFILLNFIFSFTFSFAQEKFLYPVRKVAIIASNEGFYPNKIIAFKGEKLEVFMTSTTSKKTCMLIDQHEFFIAAKKGEVSSSHLKLESTGNYKIYCPDHSFSGHLVVIDKKNSGRKVASTKIKEPSVWVPRDY
ncbi:MAG: cupredoxin domain-containing protein [Bacteriovoracaceae bacterium]|jgi:hypothetical protein|nr:cupredoxin domain-containing protein [Bacteriovoracaceae bacterium]